MAIQRTRTAILLGTAEGNGIQANNNATYYTLAAGNAALGVVTTDVDVLGNDVSVGDWWGYVSFTCTASGGTLDLTFSTHRVSGQGYVKDNADIQIPIPNGTKMIPLGKRPLDRYLAVRAFNNAGATITNLFVAAVAEILS